MVLCDLAVRESCREVAVIEQPDLHAKRAAEIDDEGDIGEPAFPIEIGMGPRLDAERADACLVHGQNRLTVGIMVLPVNP